jgi:hypothetical protein
MSSPTVDPPALALSSSSARPTSPADRAQARLFDDLLDGELAELHELAARILARRGDRSEHRLRKDLREIDARFSEVRQLLGALRDRFPAA